MTGLARPNKRHNSSVLNRHFISDERKSLSVSPRTTPTLNQSRTAVSGTHGFSEFQIYIEISVRYRARENVRKRLRIKYFWPTFVYF